MPLNWISDNGTSKVDKALDIIPILFSIDDEELYKTPFVEALKAIAIKYNIITFNRYFLGFIIQLISCVLFFSLFSSDRE